MNKDYIVVLMSTYNGEKYIREQIDSILSQKSVNLYLLIRDDGSKDSTISILKEYEKNDNVKVVYGENIGAKESFLWLIDNAPSSNYYSFSDQDDVWNSDKLISAVSILKKYGYVLYHGLAGKVDRNLKPIYTSPYQPIDSFGAALLSSATGCTMVFTNKLMGKLRLYHPTRISMHDAWVYRVCYALGYKVYYDPVSHMKYRQHENNVSGGQMTFTQKYNRILKNKDLKYKVALDIYDGFKNEMPITQKETIELFLDYKKNFYGKLKVLISNRFNQKKFFTTIQNKILFMLNLI